MDTQSSVSASAIPRLRILFNPWIYIGTMENMHHCIPYCGIVCVISRSTMRSTTNYLICGRSVVAGWVVDRCRNIWVIPSNIHEWDFGCAKALYEIRIQVLHCLAKFLWGCFGDLIRLHGFSVAVFIAFQLEETTNITKGDIVRFTGMADTEKMTNEVDHLLQAFLWHGSNILSWIVSEQRNSWGHSTIGVWHCDWIRDKPSWRSQTLAQVCDLFRCELLKIFGSQEALIHDVVGNHRAETETNVSIEHSHGEYCKRI